MESAWPLGLLDFGALDPFDGDPWVLTVDPGQRHALEEADEKEREPGDAVVDQVQQVDAATHHHREPQQERAEDHQRPETRTPTGEDRRLNQLVYNEFGTCDHS